MNTSITELQTEEFMLQENATIIVKWFGQRDSVFIQEEGFRAKSVLVAIAEFAQLSGDNLKANYERFGLAALCHYQYFKELGEVSKIEVLRLEVEKGTIGLSRAIRLVKYSTGKALLTQENWVKKVNEFVSVAALETFLQTPTDQEQETAKTAKKPKTKTETERLNAYFSKLGMPKRELGNWLIEYFQKELAKYFGEEDLPFISVEKHREAVEKASGSCPVCEERRAKDRARKAKSEVTVPAN